MGASRTITLQIAVDQDPLQGRLLSQPDLDRPFTGWIGLLAALQETIGAAGPDTKVRGPHHDDSPLDGT